MWPQITRNIKWIDAHGYSMPRHGEEGISTSFQHAWITYFIIHSKLGIILTSLVYQRSTLVIQNHIFEGTCVILVLVRCGHTQCILRFLHTARTLCCFIVVCNDDVIKWKHFPCYWPFVRGIHRSPVNSPHKGQWRGAFMFSLICAWINGCVNNHKAGDLRRNSAHYNVTVM